MWPLRIVSCSSFKIPFRRLCGTTTCLIRFSPVSDLNILNKIELCSFQPFVTMPYIIWLCLMFCVVPSFMSEDHLFLPVQDLLCLSFATLSETLKGFVDLSFSLVCWRVGTACVCYIPCGLCVCISSVSASCLSTDVPKVRFACVSTSGCQSRLGLLTAWAPGMFVSNHEIIDRRIDATCLNGTVNRHF